MNYINAPLTRLHYSRTDDSWYGWWANGEPATISASRMQKACLELNSAYKQQGLTAVAAWQQAQAEVHSMTYWNARAAAAAQMRKLWSVWAGVGLATTLGLLALQFLR